MRNLSILLCASICAFSFSQKLNAQCGDPDVFCQDTALHYTCFGSFLDNGGDGIYSEVSSSLTFCPDVEGFRANITFATFDLDEDMNPDFADQLVIYDGTSESDPLIGTYSGSALAGQTISASNGNPSGCLLVQFVSAGSVNTTHSGWSASISCTQPCVPPTASASIQDALFENDIYLKCLYDAITLSATGSVAAAGHTIVSYTWDFKDGSTVSSSDINVQHTYEGDAIYDVRLVVTDDVGCADDVVLHLGVVGAPEIDLPNTVSACVGAEVVLDAAYEPNSINNGSTLTNNTVLFLPDGAGFSYQTEIFVTGYQAGASITSCDDFAGVFVNMEHSYMGDLGITLICPNGTSIPLIEWPNGGNGTFLGEPIDDNGTSHGVGYDYSWTADASNLTWGQAANGGSLPSGDYYAANLCNVVGCPINGNWSLIVTDNLGIDNGYIFNWGVGLAPSTNVDALEYTTTINEDATSSFWSGAGISSLSENADEATVNTTELGTINLQYTTIDNVGCSYTQDYTVQVIENPIMITLEDYFTYDEFNTYLYPQSSGMEWPNALQWTWSPADGLGAPNSQYTEVLIPNDNDAYTVTATSPTLLGCIASETIGMGLPELVVSGYIFHDANQNGIFDNGETPLAYFPYTTNNGTIAFSDADGFYSAYCTYGSNTVTLEADASLWTLTTPGSFTTILDDNQNESINNNFGIVPNGNAQTILNGEISNSNTWCLFENTQTISVSNDGNTQPSGYVIYTFDALCTFISAEPAPYLIEGNNLYFSFDALNFAEVAAFSVVLDMPDNAENGDMLSFSLQTFYYDGLDAQLVETDPIVSPLLCSYDPNDKREMNGEGEQGIIAPNTELDYIIRFQNTGTAPAIDVVITDQLPVQLQFATLDPVLASHAYTASVTAQGLVTFVFDNIMLPDSGSAFEESIGFIHFRIQQQPNLANGTVINNGAKIYFDANSPIITNATTTTIFQCTTNELNIAVDGLNIEILDAVSDVQWYFNGSPMLNIGYAITATQTGVYSAVATLPNGCIATSEEVSIVGVNEILAEAYDLYPNPTKGIANLQLGTTSCDVVITNALGQNVISMTKVKGLQQIDCEHLPHGTYIIQITNSQFNSRLKLVVE